MVAQVTETDLALAAVRLSKLREADPWGRSRRPAQVPPASAWRTWMLMAGRGFGKTRVGAEWVRELVQHGDASRIALVGPTAADVRDVMIEGESGLLACCERYGIHATYQPSKRRVVFRTGAIATTFSAEEPDRLRGPQHDAAWLDEVAAWRYPATYDNLQMGLRLGAYPRQVITTTPKPVTLVKQLVAQERTGDGEIVITRGSTFDNAANLAPSFLETITDRYQGTRLGRQELEGELLEDVEGALWSIAMLDACRVREAPELARIVVAVDPATTHGEASDATGIAVAGRARDGQVYVLHAEGVRLSPAGWANRVADLVERFGADAVVAETNQGGEMVSSTLRSVNPRLRVVTVHATRGKTLRAEPIVALYEQGKAHHVGVLAALEEQMTAFPVAAEHDDIVDATVHALTELAAPYRPKHIRGVS